jgi:hypothetical protein
MRRDEILNMSAGREMDALIAEWVIGGDVYLGADYYFSSPYNRGGHRYIPHYSTDIAAAWEVAEWLFKRGLTRITNGDGDSCDVDHVPLGLVPVTRFADVSAETFPLAICRAALLATMYL